MKQTIRYSFFLILLIATLQANATHNRAGEITYRRISGYTFEVTITTFTYSLSPANRDDLRLSWGDNTYSDVLLKTRETLPDFYYHNTYVATHTYSGPGSYELLMEDPNRNLGIMNIPNSVNTVFSIKSTLIINPLISTNSTPILSNPPIDKAAVGVKFIHNPGAYDPDGDSLSFKLTTCTEEQGKAIANYQLPKASIDISVDPKTGDFVWNAPMEEGNYNVAILVEEWRNGVKIGTVVRDMQITVVTTSNHPPVIDPLKDLCVIAGDTVTIDVTATDADLNMVEQIAMGAPFDSAMSKDTLYKDIATFSQVSSVKGTSVYRFRWITDCNRVQKQPWNVLIKATDDDPFKLVDIDNFSIHVVAPAPSLILADPLNNSVHLTWLQSPCANASGYQIYRRQDKFASDVDTCKGGVTAESRYVHVGTVKGYATTEFTDTSGLFQGAEYCYVVVAYFADGSLSLPSNEMCATIKPGLPAIISVSVVKNDPLSGKIRIAWIRPKVDTISWVKPPYTYKIYRSDLNLTGSGIKQIGTLVTSNLNDTVYVDSLLNTEAYPYTYSIEMYDSNTIRIGEKVEKASSFYPALSADNHRLILTIMKNTPWSNQQYAIYRLNEATSVYDSIGVTYTTSYVDSNLVNGTKYCYKAKSTGSRVVETQTYSTTNWSHISCGIPQDTIPPCQPPFDISDSCSKFFLTIRWHKPLCAQDAIKYNLYYSPTLNTEATIVATIPNPNDSVYIYRPASETYLKGCFYITGIDSFNNESRVSTIKCSDVCFEYSLPNFFSPNNDGVDDTFMPINSAFVKKVDMKIYNRWGILVYETTDPQINWDGRFYKNSQVLPTGIYYYVCVVYEDRLAGQTVRPLTGFIHLVSDPIANQQPIKE